MKLNLEQIKWLALLIMGIIISIMAFVVQHKDSTIDSLEAKIRLAPLAEERKQADLRAIKLEEDYKKLKKQFDKLLAKYKRMKNSYLEFHQPTRNEIIREANESIKQLKKGGKLI